MSVNEIKPGDLVTWGASFGTAMLDEVGVVIQFENCDEDSKTEENTPCKVWVLWNGKNKLAWTVPEMLKRIDKPVQNYHT